jgi:uncharacterized repeat protein (TIGR01451 family)
MKTMMWLLMVVLIVGLGGCCKQKAEPAAMEPVQGGCPKVESAEGMSTQTAVFPGQSANMIRLERLMPGQIRAGQPFGYDIIVTNLTDSAISEVMVMENLGENFQYKSSAPEGKLDGKQLTWMMSDLGPKAVQKITVTGMVEKAGKLAQCADVKYKMPSCSMVDVVAPELALTKTIVADSLVCDKIDIKYVITNKGTGVVRNAVITDNLAEGHTTLDGAKTVSFQVCPLGPGQSQEFTVTTQASKIGEYSSKAMAKADGGISAEAAGVVKVHQPVLAIEEKSTEKGFIGRPMKCAITVTNKGDAPAAKAMLHKQMPAGARFMSATDGGTAAAGAVSWDLGTLAPQAAKMVEVTYTADVAGEVKTVTQATAECAAAAMASSMTQVAGIPAILLEVVDVADPILKGEDETYVITVTNQGSASDTNIRLIAKLEDGVQYVSSTGATTVKADGQKITFEPLPNLAAKAVATWNVVVKGNKTGDTRFEIEMTSDQLGSKPVMETESTRFYE